MNVVSFFRFFTYYKLETFLASIIWWCLKESVFQTWIQVINAIFGTVELS